MNHPDHQKNLESTDATVDEPKKLQTGATANEQTDNPVATVPPP